MSAKKGVTFYQRSEEEIIEALIASHGLISRAATMLGMKTQSLQARIRDHQNLQDAMKEARESFKDLAEHKLYEHVDSGSLDAIKYTLSHIGRDRGYGDSQEINMNANVNADVDLTVLTMEELKKLNELTDKITKGTN
jgi:hypothetical protein